MRRFIKIIENFICQHCGNKVKGTGYTNHCPKCLYSQHVDVNPGDRQETCHGLMPPVDFETKKGEYILIHKCQKCGVEKRNKISPQDDINRLIKLQKSLAKSSNF